MTRRPRTLLTLRQLGTRARISPRRVKVLHTIGATPRPDARDGEGWPLYTPTTAEAWITAARRGDGISPSWWLKAPETALTTKAAAVLTVIVRRQARECLVTVWGGGENEPQVVIVYHDSLVPTWAIADGIAELEAQVAARCATYRATAAVWSSVLVEEWRVQAGTWQEMTPRAAPGGAILSTYTRTSFNPIPVRRLLPKPPTDTYTNLITSGDLAEILGRPVPIWPSHAFEPAQAAGALLRDALPYEAEYDILGLRPMAAALEILDRERARAEHDGWHRCLTRLAAHLAELIAGRQRSYPPFPVTPKLYAGYNDPDDDLTSAVTLVFPELSPSQELLVHSYADSGDADTVGERRADLDALRTARIGLNDFLLTGAEDVHAAVELAYGRLALVVGNFYPQVRTSDHRPHVTRILRGDPTPGSLLARYLATVRWQEPDADGPDPRRARAWHALLNTTSPHTVSRAGIDAAGNMLARTGEPDAPDAITLQWPIGHWTDAAPAPEEACFIGARQAGAGWLFLQHPDGTLAPLPLAPGSATVNYEWGPEHRASPAAASIAFAVGNWRYPEPTALSAWLDDRLSEADRDRYFALPVRDVRQRYAVDVDEH